MLPDAPAKPTLCKNCQHCLVPVRKRQPETPPDWEYARCSLTGYVSYVTGERTNMRYCEDYRKQIGPICHHFTPHTPEET